MIARTWPVTTVTACRMRSRGCFVENGALIDSHEILIDVFVICPAAASDSGAMLRIVHTAEDCLTMIPWSCGYLSLSHAGLCFDPLWLVRANSTEPYHKDTLTSRQHRFPKINQDAKSVVRGIGGTCL